MFLRYRLTALLATLSILSFSMTLSAEPLTFQIDSGTVTTTGSFCGPDGCISETSTLKGELVADVEVGKILFPSSELSSDFPWFELPHDPELDEGGTMRTVTFTFDGQLLSVEGSIDSRAFDGPLMEYQFTASIIDGLVSDDYYYGRQDFRKCISPMCGGIFVRKVNHRFTECPDGTIAKECYIGTVDWGRLKQSSFAGDEVLVLEGHIEEDADLNGKGLDAEFGVFSVSNVFRAVGKSPRKGKLYGLENNGLVCITSPCFSYDSTKLNHDKSRPVSSVSFDCSLGNKEEVERAQALLANGEQLISSGYYRKTVGLAGRGREFVVKSFYLPVQSQYETKLCPEGYFETDAGCATQHGCFFPQLELVSIGGAAMEDPLTGEPVASISYSCVDECEMPGFLTSPGYCEIALP